MNRLADRKTRGRKRECEGYLPPKRVGNLAVLVGYIGRSRRAYKIKLTYDIKTKYYRIMSTHIASGWVITVPSIYHNLIDAEIIVDFMLCAGLEPSAKILASITTLDLLIAYIRNPELYYINNELKLDMHIHHINRKWGFNEVTKFFFGSSTKLTRKLMFNPNVRELALVLPSNIDGNKLRCLSDCEHERVPNYYGTNRITLPGLRRRFILQRAANKLYSISPNKYLQMLTKQDSLPMHTIVDVLMSVRREQLSREQLRIMIDRSETFTDLDNAINTHRAARYDLYGYTARLTIPTVKFVPRFKTAIVNTSDCILEEVRTVKKLQAIGIEMINCVGNYFRHIGNHNTAILYGTIHDTKVCIEVAGDDIVQALKKRNDILTLDQQDALMEWAKPNHLRYRLW
jgi:hypothetical protein